MKTVKFTLEINLELECEDNKSELVKDTLENKGWFICQEIKLDKIIAKIDGVKESGYDVVVTEITQ